MHVLNTVFRPNWLSMMLSHLASASCGAKSSIRSTMYTIHPGQAKITNAVRRDIKSGFIVILDLDASATSGQIAAITCRCFEGLPDLKPRGLVDILAQGLNLYLAPILHRWEQNRSRDHCTHLSSLDLGLCLIVIYRASRHEYVADATQVRRHQLHQSEYCLVNPGSWTRSISKHLEILVKLRESSSHPPW